MNSSPTPLVNFSSQLRLKREENKLLLSLPQVEQEETSLDWVELCQELQSRLEITEGTWQPDTLVYLMAGEHLVDSRQLQMLAAILDQVKLKLTWVCTSRRQTAVAAATAGYSIEQQLSRDSLTSSEPPSTPIMADPLYLETTIRSGVEIRHPGNVVIVGDLNPGGSIIALGDIIIWGKLKGTAHAGAQGNRKCRIMALKMEPTQLRIADLVARAPDSSPAQLEPEVAYITKQGICIAKAVKFAKTHTFSLEAKGWMDSETNTINNSKAK
ncbi:septum site-determining protein MinC [Gloeocapsa sp. PCC 73106]|uniref:septum site-determining protein MinC n=1 Tax=Gloeocapsa sp. PCC 73106 TaxID=102232 RepID=UPI0002ABAC1C|nr:septum site-determining protein MinC [Gloeocapsa sp. PCC 73106]ELR97103.1 septum formation inhibitor [Gloeocapsa sp. PCC 73106]